jgi:hypothetical protein
MPAAGTSDEVVMVGNRILAFADVAGASRALHATTAIITKVRASAHRNPPLPDEDTKEGRAKCTVLDDVFSESSTRHPARCSHQSAPPTMTDSSALASSRPEAAAPKDRGIAAMCGERLTTWFFWRDARASLHTASSESVLSGPAGIRLAQTRPERRR